MSTVTIAQVREWISHNPLSTACLKPFTPPKKSLEGVPDIPCEGGWTRQSVTPATPLSAVLLAQDYMYASCPLATRKSMLRDELTDLQEKSMIHLKGRQWPVRKTSEGLAAAGLEEGRASAWPAIGWNALCALRECQLVLLNEDKKQITFYPEDVRLWSSERDTLVLEHEARYLYTSPKPIHEMLGLWLSEQEQQGWTIPWPEADGTMEELKAAAEKANLVSSKLKKEVLQKRVGRAESVALFSSWAH